MAGWGTERTFTEGDNKVRVIPEIHTGGVFADPIDTDIIDGVTVIHMDGNQQIMEGMIRKIRQNYVGQPYTVWKS